MPLTFENVVPALTELLCEKQCCTLLGHSGRVQHFGRGNHRGEYMLVCMDTWFECPMFIDVRYGTASGKGTIDVTFRAPDGYAFYGDDADEFHELAATEFDLIFKQLREWRDSDDGNVEVEEEGTDETDNAEDYAALELQPGASWPEVQAAYREACLRYHPDRLVGQSKHLVELAVREFRVRTEAYHHLKERLVG
jgi:hypothetical protein